MDVECQKCGTMTPMNRMFCNSCGAKIDIRDASQTIGASRQRNTMIKLIIQVAVIVVALIILIPLGLSIWPHGSLDGAAVGNLRAGDDARTKLGSLVDAKRVKASEAKVLLSEEEVNGYLMMIRDRIGDEDKTTVQVDIHRGIFHARIITPRQKPAWLKPVSSMVSYDLVGVCDGQRLYPRKAKIGHLPVMAGRKRDVIGAFMQLKLKASDGEKELMKIIRTIDLDDDVVILDI